MQTAKVETTQITKAVSDMDTPEKFKLSAIGSSGLNIFSGVTYDELQQDLQWPNSVLTYKKMTYSVPVNACLSLFENLISKVKWRVKPPKDASTQELEQTKFIEECLHDMDVPFRSIIKDALSSNIYGFAILEKVYRKRNKESGSIYLDNKIGLKKISLRNQETIEGFLFDEKTGDIKGVKQNLDLVSNLYSRTRKGTVVIPRSKILHITVGRNRQDPFGKSPLRDVYMAWRYLEALAEMEATGVQKDLQGIPVFKVPAQYMSADASVEQKTILENLKNILRNLQANSQSGIMIPSAVDEMTRQPLFDISLLSSEGGKKNYDVSKIKEFYQNQIYTGLFADVLILGSNGVGSFALGQIKNSLTGSAVESMLDNIVESFNRDVIRQLYELNGWDITKTCSLDYENLHSADLETISKFWQRVASVGLVEKDREVLNAVRTAIGVDPYPSDVEPNLDLITPQSSRAGDGMTSPGEGTSNNVSGNDASSNNLENTA